MQDSACVAIACCDDLSRQASLHKFQPTQTATHSIGQYWNLKGEEIILPEGSRGKIQQA
jgi:hypothetical protein